MKTITTTLKSVSPYSQSAPFQSPKLDKEKADDYEKRCWRDRIHTNPDGEVVILPMALKNCLSEAAKYLALQIPGKGKATYTKHFEAGVLVVDPVRLGVRRDDVEGEWLYLNADGKRGSGTRVWRCMPVLREWRGTAVWHVLDDTITSDVFQNVLKEAGQFIGIGRFRPRNNGFYGRFAIESIEVTQS